MKLEKTRPDETLEQVLFFNNEKKQVLVNASHQVYAAVKRAVACESHSAVTIFKQPCKLGTIILIL